MAEQMTETLALHTQKFYFCARCWGPLRRLPGPGRNWLVDCQKDPEHAGFVTKYWVEKQRQKDQGNARDARFLLRQIGIVPDPHAGKSEAELRKEMGY